MDSKEKNLTFQIQFWTLLGPLIIIITLLIFLLRAQGHELFLPVMACLGVPVVLRWGKYGFLISSCLLAGLVVYLYSITSPSERFWYLGMGVAIALAQFVTYLCLEEVRGIIVGLCQESTSRWSQLFTVDQSWREKQQRLTDQLEEQKAEVDHFKELVEQQRQQIKACDLLREITRREISLANEERCRLLDQLYAAKGEQDQLKQQLNARGVEENQTTMLVQIERLKREKSLLETTLKKLESELAQC